jgi:hypothetical protein
MSLDEAFLSIIGNQRSSPKPGAASQALFWPTLLAGNSEQQPDGETGGKLHSPVFADKEHHHRQKRLGA